MKSKLILLLLSCYSITEIKSQNNLDFEDWVYTSGYESPNNWSTMNFLSLLNDSLSCIKSNDAISGIYSAKIRPVYYRNGQVIFNGGLVQKFQYSKQPDKFKFSYKYTTSQIDTSNFSVKFYKGNTYDSNNVIGYSTGKLQSIGNWADTSIKIKWLNSQLPDTAIIVFSSGRNHLEQWLYIDQIQFNYPSNLSQNECKLNYFINISKNGIVFGQLPIGCELRIFNSNGEIAESTIVNTTSPIKLNLDNGIYFYTLIDSKSMPTNIQGSFLILNN